MLPLNATNVLVCLRYGIGDVVMELPVLGALRDALPDARITALATAPADQLLENDPRVDRVVLTSAWELTHRWDEGSAETRGRILEWATEQEFDLVLNTEQATTAVKLALKVGGFRSVEASVEEGRDVVRAGGSAMEAIRSATVAGWGLEVPADPPSLQPGADHYAFADRYLDELGAAGLRPKAVSPVASHDLKRWPVESFAAVADWIAERYGGPVLVLEGPQAEHGQRVVAAMERPDDAVRVGPHHLMRTAALLARCGVLVCNDTGLLHVAAAVGTPTVGVFGPTRADLYLPGGTHTVAVEPAGLDCYHRPTTSLFPPACWSTGHCLIDDRSCSHRTRLEDVRSAVEMLLDRGPERAQRRERPASARCEA